ncbi:MAG TPA: alpha/beta hydrolase [Kangiella sp.]
MVRIVILLFMIQLSGSIYAKDISSSTESRLPVASQLININDHNLHVREMGVHNPLKPDLLLLSGPTDNWHSDSAWWALGQNFLAQEYHTIAIDRAGHAWSETISEPSYRQFAADLSNFILERDRPVILVAFASSNLSVHSLMQNADVASLVKGTVLIDPDVLTDHSIEHYSSETERYRKGWSEIEQFINDGKYDEIMQQKINEEREHLQAIISAEHEHYMDWDFYSAVETIRNTRSYQLEKFRETTHYREDLIQAQSNPLPVDLPLVIIDSDFETGYLPKIEDESVKASIIQWRDEGRDWFFQISQNSECGAYWPIASQEHLIMMEQPELLTRAIEKLLRCEQKKN